MLSRELDKESNKTALAQAIEPAPRAVYAPAAVTATNKTWERIASKEWALLIAGMAVASAWHLWSLMRTPIVFVDEGWFGNRAWAWLETGRAFGSVDQGHFGQFPDAWRYFGTLQAAINGLGIELFGLRLESMRLLSLAAGLLLIVVLWLLARQVGGARAGWLAAIILALSIPFATSAHLGRTDILIALVGTAALLLLNGAKAGTRAGAIRALSAGLLVGLGLDIHPISAVGLPPLLIMLLADSGLRIWRDSRAWAVGAGFAAGALLFVTLHILPDPATYQAISALAYGDRTPPLLSLNTWSDVAVSVGNWLFGSLVIWLVPLLLALATLLWRGPRRWSLAWLAQLAAIAVVARSPRAFYAILMMPLAALVLAIWLDRLFPRRWAQPLGLALPRALVLAMMVGGALIAQIPALNNASADYEATLTLERAAIPRGSVIIGNTAHWFGLADHRFYGWESLVYYHRAHPEQTLADALDALRPDIFILDAWVDGFTADEAAIQQLPEGDMVLGLPREALASYLATHGTLLTELESSTFGRVRVYQLAYQTANTAQETR